MNPAPVLARRDETGSMAVEVVILTPVLMMFVMLIAAGGRYVAVQGDIQATARDAVRAASLERDASSAHAAASTVMQQSLDDATNCRPLATVRPRSVMLPPSGRSRPAISRSNVVLPHPEGPSSVTKAPCATSRSTWSTAR